MHASRPVAEAGRWRSVALAPRPSHRSAVRGARRVGRPSDRSVARPRGGGQSRGSWPTDDRPASPAVATGVGRLRAVGTTSGPRRRGVRRRRRQAVLPIDRTRPGRANPSAVGMREERCPGRDHHARSPRCGGRSGAPHRAEPVRGPGQRRAGRVRRGTSGSRRSAPSVGGRRLDLRSRPPRGRGGAWVPRTMARTTRAVAGTGEDPDARPAPRDRRGGNRWKGLAGDPALSSALRCARSTGRQWSTPCRTRRKGNGS